MTDHLFDTHFHLDLFESQTKVINEIEQNEIYTIAVTNLPVLFEKLNKKNLNKYIRPALGFHPELLFQFKNQIPQMWSLLTETRYIGEVGLDFKTGKEFKELQVSFFTELIKRCNHLGNKILTVHSRMSADEVVSIIGHDFNGKIILHWFSGNKKTLQRAVLNGYYISVNYSMATTKSGKEIIKMIPLDRILLETDSPFILFQKNPFNPKEIIHIIEEISNILDFNKDQLKKILWNNFKRLIE